VNTAKGYRKIHARNKLFGLELPDLLALLLVYLFLFMFSKNLFLNILVLIILYLFLTFYKKGKPPHWTESWIRFLMTSRKYPAGRETEEELFDEKQSAA
jgi:hypothetical protein